LDFGTAVALTHAEGSSVIQVRAEDVLPEHLGDIVFKALRQYQVHLEAGVLIVVDEDTCRTTRKWDSTAIIDRASGDLVKEGLVDPWL
jgi:hypothetical protein